MRHTHIYHLEEPLIDISVPKILVIIITVMVFLVIPAQVITLHKSDPEALQEPIEAISQIFDRDEENSDVQVSDNGRVAGMSTSINQDDNSPTLLENTSFLLAGLGIFFLLFSIGGIGYLIQLNKEYKLKNSF